MLVQAGCWVHACCSLVEAPKLDLGYKGAREVGERINELFATDARAPE